MIISFLNQKGGVGKTTLAFNFASYLALQNHHVLVIDADPQQSLFDLSSIREEPLNFDIISSTKVKDNLNYDYIIVDTPGFDDDLTRDIILKSDKIVLPVRLSLLDTRVLKNILDVIKKSHDMGYHADTYVVFNMVKKNNSANDLVKEKIKDLFKSEDYIQILNQEIYDSVDYQHSLLFLQSIYEYKTRQETKQNFDSFAQEILRSK